MSAVGLDHQVECGLVLEWPGSPNPVMLTVMIFGLRCLSDAWSMPSRVENPGSEVVDHNIGLLDQAVEDVETLVAS